MTTTTTTTLRPGLLVSCKTKVSGNVSYRTTAIDEFRRDDGSVVKQWETKRMVVDPVELEDAKKARSRVATLLRSVCSESEFGLLCPQANAGDLKSVIAEARKVADDFNRRAKTTVVSVRIVTGTFASDDIEAIRAIKSEVRDLIDAMAGGVQTLDVKAIRDAADKAKDIGQMLSPKAQAQVEEAIEAARKAARNIAKAGEAAAVEVDALAVAKIAQSRTAFLDLDDVVVPVAQPQAQGRAVDLEINEIAVPVIPGRDIEMEF